MHVHCALDAHRFTQIAYANTHQHTYVKTAPMRMCQPCIKSDHVRNLCIVLVALVFFSFHFFLLGTRTRCTTNNRRMRRCLCFSHSSLHRLHCIRCIISIFCGLAIYLLELQSVHFVARATNVFCGVSRLKAPLYCAWRISNCWQHRTTCHRTGRLFCAT